MSEWQPIKTAPKDGTMFLAVYKSGKKYYQVVGRFAPNGQFICWPGNWRYQPANWKPLSDPPKDEP